MHFLLTIGDNIFQNFLRVLLLAIQLTKFGQSCFKLFFNILFKHLECKQFYVLNAREGETQKNTNNSKTK